MSELNKQEKIDKGDEAGLEEIAQVDRQQDPAPLEVSKSGDIRTDKDFNFKDLRLPQDYAQELGGKKLLTRVPTDKPARHWFVRVHPDPSYRMLVGTIALKAERELYIVHPSIAPDLTHEFRLETLYTGINRQGTLFLWPVPLPGSDGKHNPWHASALQAAELAMTKWIRMTSDMNLGAYVIFEAMGSLPEPEWPDLSFEEILGIAFKDTVISDTDHPVLRKLRGEI